MRKILITLLLLIFGMSLPGYAETEEGKIQRLENQVQELILITRELQIEVQQLKAARKQEAGETWYAEEESEEARAESNFIISGYVDTRFRVRETDDSTFQLGHFNPIFLYRFSDRLFAEGEIEVELEREEGEEGSTEIKLEYANINYILNDYLTMQAGYFFLPLGVFQERLHPSWINKLPTKPLPYDSRIIPVADVGLQLRGAAPVGDVVVRYAGFVSNGPTEADGTLSLRRNYTDNNGNKAVGGRAAIMYPFGDNDVEIGLSGIVSEWSDQLDLRYNAYVIDAELHLLEQLLELRGELLFTREEFHNVANTNNDHHDNGGYYAQIAYKLAKIDLPFFKDSEMVFRYGRVNSEDAGEDREQYSFGWNYYFTNTFRAQLAYDINQGETDANDANMLNVQLSYGF